MPRPTGALLTCPSSVRANHRNLRLPYGYLQTALIDDITSILDDVSVLIKTAAVKTTGVMVGTLRLRPAGIGGA